MSKKRSEWVNVGILLGNDPRAVAKCPECSISNLKVKDIDNEADTKEFERIIYCKICGAKTILRMHRNV